MDLSRLDIHLENLLPGLATVWAIYWLHDISSLASATDSFGGGLLLIGVCYLLGGLVNIIGRMLLDLPSEWNIRAMVFRRFCKGKLQGVDRASPAEVNSAYTRYIEAALADTVVWKEVEKRRQTGRLLRSTLVPLFILTIGAFEVQADWSACTVICAGAILLAEFVVLLFLYALAEVAILHEAYFAVPAGDRHILSEVEQAEWAKRSRPPASPPAGSR